MAELWFKIVFEFRTLHDDFKERERLHVEMPFDEFISRLIRVKPDKTDVAWKKTTAKK